MRPTTSDAAETLLKGLTEPQREAVTHQAGPLLVLAGAGSGKTRTITRRIAYLVAAGGVAPGNILAVTFTNKAAGEMSRRTMQLLTAICPRYASAATVSTFHSLGARLLREFAPQLGAPAVPNILDTADQLKVVKQAVEKVGLSAEHFPPPRVLHTISGAKNRLQQPEAFAASAEGRRDYFHVQVGRIYGAYEELLRAAKAVDFDDLLLKTALLLRDHAAIREQLQDRYHHLLIDEYQDTNHAQFVIAHMLALGHGNICATGDPDQSIYAWRGANLSNILDFEKYFPNAKVVRLEQNYRSTKTILRAASGLISHNRMRKRKALWTDNPAGARITLFRAADEHQEAAEIVRRLRDFHDRHAVAWDQMAVFYRVNSISRVLEDALMKAAVPYQIARGTEFYARKEVKDVLAYLKLLANPDDDLSCERILNVPARGVGETSTGRLAAFAAGQRISLLAACRRAAEVEGLTPKASHGCLKFAALIDALRRQFLEPAVRSGDPPPGPDPIDTAAEPTQDGTDFAATGSPSFGTGGNRTVSAQAGDPADPLFDPVLATASQEADPDAASTEVDMPPPPSAPWLRRAPVARILEAVIDGAGFIDKAAHIDEETLQRQSNIQELINVAAEFDRQNPAATLADYLQQVALVSDVDRLRDQSGAVTLMTLHAAKGLEFPVVAIAAVEEGLLPHSRVTNSDNGPRDIEEERRLLFVGMTRAMQHLLLSYSCYRMVMGRSEGRVGSSFLEEIPKDCLEPVDLMELERPAGSPGYRDNAVYLPRAHRRREPSPTPPRRGSTGAGQERGAASRFRSANASWASRAAPPPTGVPAAEASIEPRTTGMRHSLRSGLLVRHPTFGLGRVAEIHPAGDKTRVMVDFQGRGRTTLVLPPAPLEPVDGE